MSSRLRAWIIPSSTLLAAGSLAQPAYAFDMDTGGIVILLVLIWLGTLVLAVVIKYIFGQIFLKSLRDKRLLDFFGVGICELGILGAMGYTFIFLHSVIRLVGLGDVLRLGRLEAVVVPVLYSVLAVFPNAWLLKDQNVQPVRGVLASRRNAVYAWLLGLIFLISAKTAPHVVSLFLSGLGS